MIAGQALGFTDPFTGSPGWVERYGDQPVSQFNGAEMIAEKWDISREDMEAFAVESHERAHPGPRRGPLRAARSRRSTALTADEGPREPELGQDPLAADAGARAAGSPPPCASQISDALGRRC